MHRHMYHSLLHLAEGEITNVNVNQAFGADNSKMQIVSNASSVVQEALWLHMLKPRERKFRAHLTYF